MPVPTGIATLNFVAVGQTIWVYVGGPKNFGNAGARTPWWGHGWCVRSVSSCQIALP